jgi:hypothetical protein
MWGFSEDAFTEISKHKQVETQLSYYLCAVCKSRKISFTISLHLSGIFSSGHLKLSQIIVASL